MHQRNCPSSIYIFNWKM